MVYRCIILRLRLWLLLLLLCSKIIIHYSTSYRCAPPQPRVHHSGRPCVRLDFLLMICIRSGFLLFCFYCFLPPILVNYFSLFKAAANQVESKRYRDLADLIFKSRFRFVWQRRTITSRQWSNCHSSIYPSVIRPFICPYLVLINMKKYGTYKKTKTPANELVPNIILMNMKRQCISICRRCLITHRVEREKGTG